MVVSFQGGIRKLLKRSSELGSKDKIEEESWIVQIWQLNIKVFDVDTKKN